MTDTEHHSGRAVAVVLVNWNSGEFTIPCIRSLMAGSVIPDRVYVYDNGSADGSPDTIASEFPRARLIRSPVNVGFAAACNACIRDALHDNIDVIWLLNNDTLVEHTCLECLLRELKQPDVDVATGKILFADNPKKIWYGGGGWHRWRMSSYHTGYGDHDNGQCEHERDVTFVSGCCMAIKGSSFAKVGLLDERYFAYSEDAEWCWRASLAGLRMRYQPAARLLHYEASSVRKNTLAGQYGRYSSFVIWIGIRNRIFLIRQHAPRPWRLSVAMLSVFADAGCALPRLLLLGRLGKAMALLRGVHDGFVVDLALATAPINDRASSPADSGGKGLSREAQHW